MEDKIKEYGQSNFDLPHDVVTLPSMGIFYKNKKKSIKVGYLTAADENLLLGNSSNFVVQLLRNKIYEYDIRPEDMIEGDVEGGRLYVENDFNKIIEIKAREQKRVEIFMNLINQNEKTLVFCANQAHALQVRDLINQLKTSTDPNYCQRVTADDGELGEQHLRDFQDNEKTINDMTGKART